MELHEQDDDQVLPEVRAQAVRRVLKNEANKWNAQGRGRDINNATVPDLERHAFFGGLGNTSTRPSQVRNYVAASHADVTSDSFLRHDVCCTLAPCPGDEQTIFADS